MTPSAAECQHTILVVEDEQGVRSFIRVVLANDGFQVIEAGSGEEALHRSQGHPGKIDLVLSDVHMPGMTGIELVTQLQRERPDTKIMLMSASVPGVMILDPRWPFLRKPFRSETLRERIRAFLREGVEG